MVARSAPGTPYAIQPKSDFCNFRQMWFTSHEKPSDPSRDNSRLCVAEKYRAGKRKKRHLDECGGAEVIQTCGKADPWKATGERMVKERLAAQRMKRIVPNAGAAARIVLGFCGAGFPPSPSVTRL